MRLRFTKQLHSDLKDACAKYNIELVTLCEMALRKWNRLKNDVADLKHFESATNTNPITLRINPGLTGGKKPVEIKQIIAWYIADQKSKRKTIKPAGHKRRAGVFTQG